MVEISVIIPSYRPGAYIFNTLSCVLQNQDLTSDRYEIIIVLNGDKNPYYSELKEYLEPFTNVSLVYIEETGVSNARNAGIELAVGEYLIFIDDDDEISENYLSTLLNTVKNDKRSSDIVQSNFKVKTNDGIEEDYISKAYQRLYNSNVEFSLFTYRNFLSSVTGKLFKRSVIGKERFDSKFRISEDSIFLFQISKNIKYISFSSYDCTYYRLLRDGSALRSRRSIRDILTNYFRKGVKYSEIYWSEPSKYNLKLYISRIAAISKILFSELFKNRNKT